MDALPSLRHFGEMAGTYKSRQVPRSDDTEPAGEVGRIAFSDLVQSVVAELPIKASRIGWLECIHDTPGQNNCIK
jgi:hypothetical protein